VFGGGAFLFVGASSTILVSAIVGAAGLGLCAGAVYVVGFTILHENVSDELRGRVFATLYTLVRLCLLLALGLAPFLAELLGRVSSEVFGSDQSVVIAGFDMFLPGVRLALWFGALIILAAAVLAARALRHPRSHSAVST
jgi:dTMP kinase